MKRGQDVWVKVISINGDRMSLSMRDVDQETGRDLLPQTKPAPAGDDRSNPAGEAGVVELLESQAGWISQD